MKGRGLSGHQKEWNEDQRLEGASFMPRLQQARLSQIQPGDKLEGTGRYRRRARQADKGWNERLVVRRKEKTEISPKPQWMVDATASKKEEGRRSW